MSIRFGRRRSARAPARGGGPAVQRPARRTWRLAAEALRRDPGDRWAAALGRIAVYSFAVAVISGILLLPFFRPSMTTVVYHGSYRVLDGVPMSRAYQSVLATSFDVRGGLLIRQVHHWSADIFAAVICLRLLRVFFRGRFAGRHLRGWLIWVALLPVGMLAAYTGTILPDDMLSGGSLEVVTGVLLSVPLIGTQLALRIFGGAPPGHLIVGRDYWVHIVVLPALTGLLLLASYRPSRRWLRQWRRVRHLRVDPLLLFTCALLLLLGAIAQINPVWLIGPYQSGDISAGAAPDWYMGFLDGALRLMPAWQVDLAGHPLTLSVLVPGLLVPGAFFTLLAAFPLLERKLNGRQDPPQPRDASIRTALGVAGMTFYGALWAAAANDQFADHFHLDLYGVTWFFRIAALAGPPLAYLLTRQICLGLTGREHDEVRDGRPTGRIVMTRDGGFTEITEPAVRAAPATDGQSGPTAAHPGQGATRQQAGRRSDSLAGHVPGSGPGRGPHGRS